MRAAVGREPNESSIQDPLAFKGFDRATLAAAPVEQPSG
jgi:hypothetical protein